MCSPILLDTCLGRTPLGIWSSLLMPDNECVYIWRAFYRPVIRRSTSWSGPQPEMKEKDTRMGTKMPLGRWTASASFISKNWYIHMRSVGRFDVPFFACRWQSNRDTLTKLSIKNYDIIFIPVIRRRTKYLQIFRWFFTWIITIIIFFLYMLPPNMSCD